MVKVKVISYIFLLGVFVAHADPVTVPNTFTASTPAKASEVNANFTALANAVNNSPKPLMVYDRTGKLVGQYNVSWPSVLISTVNDGIINVGISRDGFSNLGIKYSFFYTSNDCTGPAYLEDMYSGSTFGPTSTVILPPSDSQVLISGLIIIGNSGEIAFQSVNDFQYSTNSYSCRPVSGSSKLLPTKIIDLNGYLPPFSVH